MSTVRSMLASHGLQLSASDCICGRRSAVAILAACGGPVVQGGDRGQSRRLRAAQSASRTVGADQPPRRKRAASRGAAQATGPAQAPHAAATRSKRATDASATPPRRRRQRQAKAPALAELNAQQRVPGTSGLYQDCCGRLYSRSVYRVEVLDEVMLDGLRVAELCGSAAFATVTNTVTIADVLAAAGAAAAAADAVVASAAPADRAGREASGAAQVGVRDQSTHVCKRPGMTSMLTSLARQIMTTTMNVLWQRTARLLAADRRPATMHGMFTA